MKRTVRLTIELDENDIPDYILENPDLWGWQMGYCFKYNEKKVIVYIMDAEIVEDDR